MLYVVDMFSLPRKQKSPLFSGKAPTELQTDTYTLIIIFEKEFLIQIQVSASLIP